MKIKTKIFILLIFIYTLGVNNSNASTPVLVTIKGSLPNFLSGSSGIDFDGTFNFWTLNDHGNNEIYHLADDGTHINTVSISNSHAILAIANNYTQKEAVCFSSNNEIYLTDEGASKIYYLGLSSWVSASATDINDPANKNIFEKSDNMYIFDIKGSLIKKIDNYDIDINNLSSGIYILKIIYEGSMPKSTRFIKL